MARTPRLSKSPSNTDSSGLISWLCEMCTKLTSRRVYVLGWSVVCVVIAMCVFTATRISSNVTHTADQRPVQSNKPLTIQKDAPKVIHDHSSHNNHNHNHNGMNEPCPEWTKGDSESHECRQRRLMGTFEEKLIAKWKPIWESTNLSGFPNPLNPPRSNMSDEEMYPLKWGSIYPHRIWCSVLTMWPDRKENIEAVSQTWGRLCDRLVFVVDDRNSSVPSSINGFDIIKLNIELAQSKKDRNIWEKSWRTWQHVGKYHILDADWFLKIDDDTFFSAINFKGFVRYLNPKQPYYLGHTLMHLWQRANVVFNAGSCYALSSESLRRLTPIFSSDDFLFNQARIRKGRRCICLCVARPKAFEDPAIGTCLHSLGIDPLNTLSYDFRERFSPLQEGYMSRIQRRDWWYWKLKHENVQTGSKAMFDYPISFHFYKKNPMNNYQRMEKIYNIPEGIKFKYFKPPLIKPQRFIHTMNLSFTIDHYRNTLNPPIGQKIFKGYDNPHGNPVCWKCNQLPKPQPQPQPSTSKTIKKS